MLNAIACVWCWVCACVKLVGEFCAPVRVLMRAHLCVCACVRECAYMRVCVHLSVRTSVLYGEKNKRNCLCGVLRVFACANVCTCALAAIL